MTPEIVEQLTDDVAWRLNLRAMRWAVRRKGLKRGEAVRLGELEVGRGLAVVRALFSLATRFEHYLKLKGVTDETLTWNRQRAAGLGAEERVASDALNGVVVKKVGEA